jgi:hypothetical protein
MIEVITSHGLRRGGEGLYKYNLDPVKFWPRDHLTDLFFPRKARITTSGNFLPFDEMAT